MWRYLIASIISFIFRSRYLFVPLYDLYCHEIAHTLCNHVQFRVDDHHGKSKMDFPYNEQLVKTISTELKLMNHLVKLYNAY